MPQNNVLKLISQNKTRRIPWWLSQWFAVSLAVTILALVDFIREPADSPICLLWFGAFCAGIMSFVAAFNKIVDRLA